MKVISLAGIRCDLETEMLILTMYLKVFKKSHTSGKYLNTNTFHSKRPNTLKKVFKYFQIQMYNLFNVCSLPLIITTDASEIVIIYNSLMKVHHTRYD